MRNIWRAGRGIHLGAFLFSFPGLGASGGFEKPFRRTGRADQDRVIAFACGGPGWENGWEVIEFGGAGRTCYGQRSDGSCNDDRIPGEKYLTNAVHLPIAPECCAPMLEHQRMGLSRKRVRRIPMR